MIRQIQKKSLLIFCFFLPILITAQGYFGNPLEGETSGTFTHSSCKVSEFTLKYKLGVLVGEPTVYLNIKWKAGNGSPIDCLSNERFEIFLKIQPHNTGIHYYLPIKGGIGLIPKGDNTWGYNPIAGSPDWDELILSSRPSNKDVSYLKKDYAKSIWKNGLTVTNVIFLFSDGSDYTFNN